MPSITIKNIPDHAYEVLEQMATGHHRSINSELIYLIEKATTSKTFNPEEHLALAKQIRGKKILLTGDIVNMAKTEGRP
jgi:plasmid stability protein